MAGTIKEIKKVTTNTLQKMKASGEKIAMITAYDFSFATIFDAAGIDIILVGDSASNVMAGHVTTLPITLLALSPTKIISMPAASKIVAKEKS